MKSSLKPPAVAGTLAFAGIASVFAHGGATGIVKERMDGMMALRAQLGALNTMFTGGQNVNLDTVEQAANIIALHAGSGMADLFPEGSIEGPSAARPEIWTDWDAFETLAVRLEHAAVELSQAAAFMATAPAEIDVQAESEPELSEWEALDASVLLGIKTRDELAQEIDQQRLATLEASSAAASAAHAQMPRDLSEIFADMVTTCSSCHSVFRR